MLKKGILASNTIYVSTKHTEKVISEYINQLNSIFKLISKCEQSEINIDDVLDGPICHDGFKRLN